MPMPEMTGAELSVRLLAIRPDLPIILCTGFSKEIDERKVLELGVRKYLLKPLRRDALAHAIRDVLDDKKGKEADQK